MRNLSGNTFGSCELREYVAEGGFGVIYRGYQTSLDREVAVKIILPHIAMQSNFLRRFEQEALLLARLEHAFVVPVYEFGQSDNGYTYIAMRWMQGGSLRDRLERGSVPVQHFRQVLEQIAEALAFAHEQGVVHRDIKPDNILFDTEGYAYLTDFGIAKNLSLPENFTPSDHRVFSPAYAAPEQVAGEPVTKRTDIYSLGITLHECLYGCYPFPQEQWRHLYQPLPPVSNVRADIPPWADVVLRRATAHDPSKRYPDTLTFSAALLDALQDNAREMSQEHEKANPTELTVLAIPVPPQGNATKRLSSNILERVGRNLEGPPPCDRTAILLRDQDDVPARAAHLFGRDALITRIKQMLIEGKSVLLQGLAGMGKTALAAEVVHRLLSRKLQPVLWLRAGSGDTASLLEALLQPLESNVDPEIFRKSELTTTIRAIWKKHAIRLIVLDDVWNAEALRAVVEHAPPSIPILATSRQRYGGLAIVDVGALDPSNALNLLGYHAGEQYTQQNHTAQKLCAHMGFHAYALQIAGENMKVDNLTPGDLLDRIAEYPHQITSPDGVTPPGRESVSALLDVSVRALAPDDRAVFLAFGTLWTPTASPDLLAQCLGKTSKIVADSLIRLGRRGLAQRDKLPGNPVAFYRLHDLAFSYTRANTTMDRPTVVRGVRLFTEMHAASLDHLDIERINILKAAETAHMLGASEQLVAIVNALTVSGPYLAARGHDPALISLLDHAITAARAMVDQRKTLHHLLGKRGNIHRARQEFDSSLTVYGESLAIAQELELAEREIILSLVIAGTHIDQQMPQQATVMIDMAEKRAEALGSPPYLMARIAQLRGYQAHVQKDFAMAEHHFRQNVTLARQFDNPHELFYALYNLGSSLHELTRYEDALAVLAENLQLANTHNNQVWEAEAHSIIGMVYHEQGGHEDQAKHILQNALATFREVGEMGHAAHIEQYLRQHGIQLEEDVASSQGGNTP